MLNAVAIEKTLGRIGFDVWSQMTWFIKLVNSAGFETMTPGEQLSWQEDFAGMALLDCQPVMHVPSDRLRYPRSESDMAATWFPTPREMERIRAPIARMMNDIADGRGTSLPEKGCFEVSYFVKYVGNPEHQKQPDVAPRYLVFRSETSGHTHSLQRFLLRLLESFPDTRRIHTCADKLRRCPHCKKIFLQAKRTSRYCGNRCQSAVGMRRHREKNRKVAKEIAKRVGGRAKKGVSGPPHKAVFRSIRSQ